MSGTVFGACPTPLLQYRQIVLGHGSGGRLTHELIKDVFAPPGPLEDQATLPFAAGRLAVTTDSFVVKPIFFPGGDIGKLAITGSVNDLAVGGARPRFIAAAFILEEGLPLDDLRRIVASMRAACGEGEVQLVTGDTKVVDRGKGDQVFISTTAVGEVPEGVSLSIAAAMSLSLVSTVAGWKREQVAALRQAVSAVQAVDRWNDLQNEHAKRSTRPYDPERGSWSEHLWNWRYWVLFPALATALVAASQRYQFYDRLQWGLLVAFAVEAWWLTILVGWPPYSIWSRTRASFIFAAIAAAWFVLESLRILTLQYPFSGGLAVDSQPFREETLAHFFPEGR